MPAHVKFFVQAILAFCIAVCANASPPAFDESPNLLGTLYKRGDARDAVQCRGVELRSGCGSVGYGANVIFFDCSDPTFKCVMNTTDVFAVPVEGVTAGQMYETFGAKLKVERCFGNQASCEIAMISTECVDIPGCSCRYRDPIRTVFYYSRASGITAFYSYPPRDALANDTQLLMDGLPMITFVLTREQGFLKAPLDLPQASLQSKCAP